ncbi:MocR-like pyridoxine biosynthesis transcription factor PdxR [Butyrivibrio sp. VCB2006]|uniref:MocR-like pyridoxine biosynthesis transcription factor PdxR n=1 Tax=Butyrivibrio sp. VCB2006 TaxID=1280679 RepID=UPI0004079B3F|nr:PLP-dependent aminotransferase family protein [Butyrivibrio sp. VCB2006]
MNYNIDKTTSEPAYIQLYRHLVKDIVAGAYEYGTKLPSKRVIAAETGLSVITVEHALTLLNDEGYVETRPRSGVVVTYRGDDFLGGKELQKAKVTESSIAQPSGPLRTSDFPFSVLTKTMRRVMLDYGEKILVKSPNPGCIELRNELCLYLARSRGIQVKPDQIIIGSGAEYLYGLIVQLLGTKRVYAIENPSYKKIQDVYEALGVTCEKLTMTGEGISSKELAETKAQILHVTPFNSYPSGVTASISKKLEYIRWAKQRDGVLIEDNYDSELTVSRKAEEPLFSMDKETSVIYLNSFSRTIAPSMRIGYMILPESMVPEFTEKLGFYSCTVPIFDQYVIAELLKSGDFERHINRVRRRKRRGER